MCEIFERVYKVKYADLSSHILNARFVLSGSRRQIVYLESNFWSESSLLCYKNATVKRSSKYRNYELNQIMWVIGESGTLGYGYVLLFRKILGSVPIALPYKFLRHYLNSLVVGLFNEYFCGNYVIKKLQEKVRISKVIFYSLKTLYI